MRENVSSVFSVFVHGCDVGDDALGQLGILTSHALSTNPIHIGVKYFLIVLGLGAK